MKTVLEIYFSEEEMSVRVRFAPSPTGFLHVGGLRTALYNYLFAKHHGGKCILRIEDTDRTRFVENATENLIDSLKWAGVEFDEGPVQGGDCGTYIQSQRFDLYTKYGNELLDKGMAYYAFDTPEELEALRENQKKEGSAFKYDRNKMKNQITLGDEDAKKMVADGIPYVIRLKVPFDTEITFSDMIRGDVTVPSNDIDDQILLKSDGFPTYHLANVVDDRLMGITHVIRGEEWLPSTPKHVLLYDFFGWERPSFAHLPLLLNKDKTKLSKRQGSVAVEDFKQKYIKDAFVNFVALLGWNPFADREIYTMQELIDNFSIEKVNKSGAVFDTQKLDWMNAQYLRSMDPKDLCASLAEELGKKNLPTFKEDYLVDVINLVKERVNTISEIPDYAEYLFIKPTNPDLEYLKKHWKENSKKYMQDVLDVFLKAEEWKHDTLHEEIFKYLEANSLKIKEIIHTIRFIVTGKSFGAGMFETIEVLGKDEVLSRFNEFLSSKLSD